MNAQDVVGKILFDCSEDKFTGKLYLTLSYFKGGVRQLLMNHEQKIDQGVEFKLKSIVKEYN